MLEQKEITIGDNDFQYSLMSAWDANLTLLQLRKVIAPTMREYQLQGDITEQPVMAILSGLVEQLSEELFEELAFKLFKRSSVVCTTKQKKLTNQVEFNLVFGGPAGVVECYKLIFNILKENFSGFFTEAQGIYGDRSSTAASVSIPRKLAK